jgi:hypothetical protein
MLYCAGVSQYKIAVVKATHRNALLFFSMANYQEPTVVMNLWFFNFIILKREFTAVERNFIAWTRVRIPLKAWVLVFLFVSYAFLYTQRPCVKPISGLVQQVLRFVETDL